MQKMYRIRNILNDCNNYISVSCPSNIIIIGEQNISMKIYDANLCIA